MAETIGVFESTKEEGAKGKGRGMERAGDVLYLELAAGPRDRGRRGPTEERVPSGSLHARGDGRPEFHKVGWCTGLHGL